MLLNLKSIVDNGDLRYLCELIYRDSEVSIMYLLLYTLNLIILIASQTNDRVTQSKYDNLFSPPYKVFAELM